MTHTHNTFGTDARGAQLTMGALSVADASEAIRSADRILIGAGAGLSAAAGWDYTDTESFADLFPALHAAGFRRRYELMGYPLPPRHQWGYWAVHVMDGRFNPEPSPLYRTLRNVVGDREHFVMTSNVDALFIRNGFDTENVFTPQGDYGLYQCLTPCTREVWDSRPIIDRALKDYDPVTGQTSEEAVPHCPNCGGDVYLNVNGGHWYIGDHFLAQTKKLNTFLQDTARSGESLAVLELGVGFNTPSVIRWPLETVVEQIPSATFIRVNPDAPAVPTAIASRSGSWAANAKTAIEEIA